jgi:hypothetical protein
MVGGAWAGFVGWALGAFFAPAQGNSYYTTVLRASVQGMFLGVVVALGLSILDASFNVSGQIGKVMLRVLVAIVAGMFAGLFGSFVGQSLYYWSANATFQQIAFILGWTIVGLLIGVSICSFELFSSLLSGKDFGGAMKKLVKCTIGGTLGGILGGVIATLILYLSTSVFHGRDPNALWTPIAVGFVAIGACIGLLVGLAQIILKEAWIKVEAGFRPGREMLLLKEKTSIGRGEGSDIALFGDSSVEKTHAMIVVEGGRYFLEDMQTPTGSFLNENRVNGKAPLKTGDLIRVGKSVLRFNERAKRKD